jgi:hypothetical protein
MFAITYIYISHSFERGRAGLVGVKIIGWDIYKSRGVEFE